MKKILKESIKIENIYYGFDSATLRKESIPALDSLYQILADNPQLKIEIGSHTDGKGSPKYNQKLSQGRAQSVVNYMITMGIPMERLTFKGYGESELRCKEETNPDGTDNAECRQKNRRTEFKVIGTIPNVELIYESGNEGFDPNAKDTLEKIKEEEQK